MKSKEDVEREYRQREEMKESLVSGRSFSGTSARSRLGYQPPITNRQYAHAVSTIAKMARESDAFAQVAARILPKLNLYGTAPQLEAAIADAIGECVRAGYDDVVGRSGPEAGRRSDHHRAFTLSECVLLRHWQAVAESPFVSCVPGVGWVLTTIAEEMGLKYEGERILKEISR